jgi:membrane fusion protein
MAWFITAATLLILIFLFMAQYARKETVRGYLTPTAGTAKIFTLRQGTIRAVHVKEGQHVELGQPLLTIATDQIAADGEDVDATILDTLIHQKQLLTQQISAQEERTASERDRLSALTQGIESEISQLDAQIEIQDQRIQLSQDLVRSAAQLHARGNMPETEYRQRQEVYLQQKQTLSALNQKAAEQKNRLTETRYSLEQLPTIMAERMQGLRNELSGGAPSSSARRTPGGSPRCWPVSAGGPIHNICNLRSSRPTVCWKRNCLFRRGPSASSDPGRRSESCTTPFHTRASAPMAAGSPKFRKPS